MHSDQFDEDQFTKEVEKVFDAVTEVLVELKVQVRVSVARHMSVLKPSATSSLLN